MARRVKVTDTDKGFKKLVGSLGEMGSVTIGVQGKDVDRPHPNGRGETIGQIARAHELGLGVTRRSWCVEWVEINATRMLDESARQLKRVLKGTLSRNQALQKMGYKWTEQMRDRVWRGDVHPDISEVTKEKKGDDRPLVEFGYLHDAITYKVWLPQFKSIRDPEQRAAARRK